MCRLYGFRANEPTKVECTLVYAQNALMSQSRADLRGTSHPDGWGVGYYEDATPKMERRDRAAYEDLHFSVTAERLYAKTVLAHVRRATVGGAALANTHPFVYGHWAFAHNGTVRAFDRVAPELERETAPRLLFERCIRLRTARHHVTVGRAKMGTVLEKRHVVIAIELNDRAQVVKMQRWRVTDMLRDQGAERVPDRELGLLAGQCGRERFSTADLPAGRSSGVVGDDGDVCQVSALGSSSSALRSSTWPIQGK